MRSPALTGRTVNLPAPPEGWCDFGYAVLLDGSLGVMRVDLDFQAAYRQWQPRPDLRLGRQGPVRLSAFDGHAEGPVTEIGVSPLTAFERLRDGRWLVAAHRARPGEVNAGLFDPNGSLDDNLVLGDAIEHVRCMRDGTIWVGYFDEGVGSGDPFSDQGIAQVSSGGELIWGLRAEASAPWMCDCYALTLDGDRMWACYHPDFPIVRMGGQRAQAWTNDEVAGARAMAVDRDLVLLAGTYDDPALLSLVKLGTTGSTLLGQIPFEPLAAKDGHAQGQTNKLHVIHAGQWTTLEIDEVRRALA